MMPKTETVETILHNVPVNWEEDPAMKDGKNLILSHHIQNNTQCQQY